ncbi:MAG: Gene Transfer Agent (GTA) ORFG12 [Pseudolabrys sp.]|nr:Gene Transfer Agent (GTA) ORFG12 [Pseudolabrys sp.]
MPQAFRDISFPPYVARGATGGPSFSTNVVALASGAEERNILWANSRGKWNISTGIRTREQMLEVIAFFHVVKGRGYSFRLKDWNDYDASDQVMVEITSTEWQLVKRYNIGGFEHIRTITKPVIGTVTVKIAGSPVAPAGIDYLTGQVTFASAPPSSPNASFEFDVPVRFDADHLPVQANAWDQQVVSQIDLVEVRE